MPRQDVQGCWQESGEVRLEVRGKVEGSQFKHGEVIFEKFWLISEGLV